MHVLLHPLESELVVWVLLKFGEALEAIIQRKQLSHSFRKISLVPRVSLLESWRMAVVFLISMIRSNSCDGAIPR